jgi:hypothetical protein
LVKLKEGNVLTLQENIYKEAYMATLKENFKQFRGELAKISIRQRDLVEQQRETYNEYHRLLNECQELLALGEDEAAKQLDPKIKTLRANVENFQKEIEELSFERIKEIVSKHPDSKLHQMACAIQEEGLIQIESLGKELDQANNEVKKIQGEYLQAVEKVGCLYRALADVYIMTKKAEEVLPVEKGKAKRPSTMPTWIDFEISEKELSKAYGSKPYIAA